MQPRNKGDQGPYIDQVVVAHSFKPSTREAETLWVWGQPGPQSKFHGQGGYTEKACLKKSKTKQNNNDNKKIFVRIWYIFQRHCHFLIKNLFFDFSKAYNLYGLWGSFLWTEWAPHHFACYCWNRWSPHITGSSRDTDWYTGPLYRAIPSFRPKWAASSIWPPLTNGEYIL